MFEESMGRDLQCESLSCETLAKSCRAMGNVRNEAIEVIAHSIDVNTLSFDVAAALASYFEFRIGRIMQVTLKF